MGVRSESAQEPEDQKTIDVEEYAADDLDKLLVERLDAEEKGRELPSTVVVDEEEETEEEPSESEEKTEKVEDEPAEEEETDEELDERDATIAKLRKQVEEKEAIFKSHSEEVGVTRKRNAELEATLANYQTQQTYSKLDTSELGEDYDTSDVNAIDKIVQIRLRQEREAQARIQVQQQQIRTQTKDALLKLVPEIDSLLPEIANIIEREGLTDPQGLAQFRTDPYSQDGRVIYAYAQRAQLEKKVAELQADKDKLKESPRKVVAQIKKAGKKKKTIDDAGAASAGTKPPELTVERIWNDMTPEEIDKEIIRRQKEELRLRR